MIQPALFLMESIWPSVGGILAKIMGPIIGSKFTGAASEAHAAAMALEAWLASVGIGEKLCDFGFTAADVPKLVSSVHACPGMDGLLAIAPVKADDDLITSIFTRSLARME
eukprot:gnl/Ergobibamus_cyprinoides/2155.p1 GENE.gnl/Ergobibamus_cyprinoides/2155~~gnl/Ergobibamus_cyprinoides/2155.p1  ORF type:complete len:111 (-),score=55.60 gnl/Ergobibamus_cyprinoides/2155:70-402(-)